MIRKLIVVLLTGVMCLLGATSVLAVTYNEAPMLQVKVAAGELPPVEERLPEEPSVLEPLEEIGQYGGTIHVFQGANPWGNLASECGATLLRVSEDGSGLEGNIAKGYKLSEDGKNLTLYLRKGLKWSNGASFTADDIMFTFEDMHWNKDITWTWNRLPLVKRIKKIDDYTVRFEADVPYYTAPFLLAPAEGIGWRFFKPKHYLKKWHIKYNPKANDLAKEEDFENWQDALFYHDNWAPQNDLDLPTLAPWILKKFTTSIKAFERNPYYWKVDTIGNQLPYVDTIIAPIITDPEMCLMKIIIGEADISFFNQFENYPLYKENEDAGNYRVILTRSAVSSQVVFPFNLNHPDPVKRKIYQDVRFRQALSLAINREEISESCFFGLAVPCQVTVLPSSSFYKKEWGESYAQYDPDQANRLLDEVGLDERDKDGFRLRSDGKTLLVMIETGKETSFLELVKEYWEAVGVKTFLKTEEPVLHEVRRSSADHDIMEVASDDINELSLWFFTIERWTRSMGTSSWNWGLWLDAEEDIRLGRMTLEDYEGGVLPGEEPPENIKKLDEWVCQWKQVPYQSEEYREIAQKIFDFHAENLFTIGTVGMSPWVTVAKNDLQNVPTKSIANISWPGSFNKYGEQLFWKR